jgi:hypothetical protein
VDGTDWEARISAAWESFDELSETEAKWLAPGPAYVAIMRA